MGAADGGGCGNLCIAGAIVGVFAIIIIALSIVASVSVEVVHRKMLC